MQRRPDVKEETALPTYIKCNKKKGTNLKKNDDKDNISKTDTLLKDASKVKCQVCMKTGHYMKDY